MTIIEIDLQKLERGTHEGRVKVTRGGKTFYRKQRVGRKEGGPKLSEFKSELSKMDNDTLKTQIESVCDEYHNVGIELSNWYDGPGMELVDGRLSALFNLPEKTERLKRADLDPRTAEGYMKIYAITQEYLSRIEPDGRTIIYRGLGPEFHEEFKHLTPGEDIKLEQFNVSSWTTDYDMARSFAEDHEQGVVIESDIPTKRIFIHPDCLSGELAAVMEDEVVVLGSSIDAVMGELVGEAEEEDEEEWY